MFRQTNKRPLGRHTDKRYPCRRWAAKHLFSAVLNACAGAGLVGCTSSPLHTPTNSPGAFATVKYRNLLVEAGRSPQEVTERISAVFRQLFHGDPHSQAIYFSAGANSNGPMAYIHDVKNRDVRPEGMSYGMMIAVQLDQRTEFDALWNWAKSCMYHASPSHPAFGYFSWSMTSNGTPNDEMPAPDGEEYLATSLFFAAGRWGKQVYLRLLPFAGGAARVIAYLYGGQGTMNVLSWSPDGQRLAFVSNSDL